MTTAYSQHEGNGPMRAGSSREHHLGALFETVLTRGPLSRRDAARLTGLSPAAVTKLVKPMIAHGYLVEDDREAGVPGRPQIPLRVDPERHFAVGLKLMRSEVVGVIVDLHAEVQSAHRLKYSDTSLPGVLTAIEQITALLLDRSPIPRERLLGLGIGLGGHVNGPLGVVHHSPFFSWHDVPLAELAAERIGMPVVIENDVNALAVAEQWFGAGAAFNTFLVVTVGAGIGAGLVLDGRLWQGIGGAAGELGHTVVDPDGPRCHCGKHGCLEAVAGDAAIVQAMAEVAGPAGSRITRVSQVAALAHAGDADARRVFGRAGVALGRAIAALLNLLNPPMVILSGEGLAASDLFIDALRAEVERNAFSTVARDCTLLVRPQPDETWARGAAVTMLRHGVLASVRALTDEVSA